MKQVKAISVFIGASMFLFGVLKFIDPFKSWYAAQVMYSGLGESSYWLGIIGEISVGLVMMYAILRMASLSTPIWKRILQLSSAIVIIMMLTAIYVHLLPEVPADVLPLKIKPPFIPGVFLLLSGVNLYLLFQINKEK
jgi:phosphotransferase system  glucose/maltose/N-acetylglucosamine-specific IIC component